MDNCSVHNAKNVKKFLDESKINILDWPSKSLDLDIVEDIWKLLSDDIYNGVQFKNVADLKTAINSSIHRFNLERRDDIKALYTIITRLCTVLEKKGSLCK